MSKKRGRRFERAGECEECGTILYWDSWQDCASDDGLCNICHRLDKWSDVLGRRGPDDWEHWD